MKPMLAHVYEPHRVSFPCFVQPKLNGIRALYQNGSFQSRDEIPFSSGLLDHLATPLKELFGPDIVLDGELYVHGWPLQRILSAVTPLRGEPTEDTPKVEYHVFDVVDYEKSFDERHCVVDSLLDRDSLIKIVATSFLGTQGTVDKYYATWVEVGYEGIIYRLGQCPYTWPHRPTDGRIWYNSQKPSLKQLADKHNRTWHMLKRKDWHDDEFEVVDLTEGFGQFRGMLGAAICRCRNSRTFNVGSGFSEQQRALYWSNPSLIVGKQLRVKYLVLSNDGIPLNPTSLGIRERML